MAYKKFLIQQQTFNGTAYTDVGSVVDTQATFKVVCKDMPFKVLPETKDVPKRDWYDEHGDDVYIPTDGLKFKAFDIEVKFLYVGTESAMSEDLKSFISFVNGRTNIPVQQNPTRNVMLKMFDEYTQTGRRGVYVLEVSDELFFYSDVNIEAIAEFKVKFRVTDPVYEVSNNNGVLT